MHFSEAFQEELQQGGSKNSRIEKAAEDRPLTIFLTIEPQLRALMGFHCPQNPTDFWQSKANEVANIFKEAVILEGLTLSSVHYYEHEWIERGTLIDDRKMTQPHESNRGGIVKCCVGPAIWLKETVGGERIRVCKADIIPVNTTGA